MRYLVLLWPIVAGCAAIAPRGAATERAGNARAVDDRMTLDARDFGVEWIYDENFDDSAALRHWRIESEGPSVKVADGALQVRRGQSERLQSGVTLWLDRDLPADYVVEVGASTGPGEHACNLNFFLNAREADNTPLRGTRTGVYTSYHSIPNYLLTFTGGMLKGWSRARKNPGFQLLRETGDIRAEPGRRYRIAMVKEGARLAFFIDGVQIHALHDTEPLPPGRFGLRTWFSDIDYERIRIGRIIGPDLAH